MSAPDHIVRDLSRKAADDAGDRIKLVAGLLDDGSDRMMIALAVGGTALGWASGFAKQKLDERVVSMTIDEQVDLMWEIMRPIAMAAMGGDQADFQALLARCRQ